MADIRSSQAYTLSSASDGVSTGNNGISAFSADPTDGNSTIEAITAFFEEEPPSCTKYSTPVAVFLAIFFCTFTIVTLGGNILVIAAFATDKAIRSFGNYFILNLSIADLVIGILMGWYIPYFLTGCWKMSRGVCMLFIVFDYVVPLASAWNMAVISLDRYWAVARPIEYRLKQNTNIALGLMSIPWLVGIILYGPSTLFWEKWEGRRKVPEYECYVEFYDNAPFLLFASTIEFIIPFVTVTTINALIYLNIRRRSKAMLAAVGVANNSADDNKAKEALARDKKSARSLAILVGAFFVTWAPYEVCALVNPICGFCVPGLLFDVVFWFLWLNSLVNPILYPFLQRRFRVAFTRILCCGRARVHVAEESTTGTTRTGT